MTFFKDDLFQEYLVVDDRKGLLINENVWQIFQINSIFEPADYSIVSKYSKFELTSVNISINTIGFPRDVS